MSNNSIQIKSTRKNYLLIVHWTANINVLNKHQRIPKRGNLDKLVTLGTQDKENKNTSQKELDTTIYLNIHIIRHHSIQANTNNVNKTCALNIHIIRHHYIQTNTNNVNKTCVLNIHIIRHHYIQTNTNNVNKTCVLNIHVYIIRQHNKLKS